MDVPAASHARRHADRLRGIAVARRDPGRRAGRRRSPSRARRRHRRVAVDVLCVGGLVRGARPRRRRQLVRGQRASQRRRNEAVRGLRQLGVLLRRRGRRPRALAHPYRHDGLDRRCAPARRGHTRGRTRDRGLRLARRQAVLRRRRDGAPRRQAVRHRRRGQVVAGRRRHRRDLRGEQQRPRHAPVVALGNGRRRRRR